MSLFVQSCEHYGRRHKAAVKVAGALTAVCVLCQRPLWRPHRKSSHWRAGKRPVLAKK